MNNRTVKWIVTVVAVALIIFLLQQSRTRFGESDEPLKYSQFLELIDSGNVKQGKFIKDMFEGEYNHKPATASSDQFTVNVAVGSQTQNALFDKLSKAKVPFELSKPLIPDWMQGAMLSLLLPFILIGAFYFFVLRQAQSGGNQAMSFGRARAKRLTDNAPKVTFDDVAGLPEAKEELQEIVEFLKNAKKFHALGAKIPKGVLLLGPPGCGKTMLARAIACEAGVPFFHISGSDFVEMFVGVGASRVRDLFDTAKSNRPALIFIDEIDAVGRQRGAGLGGGHDEREQTLNQLLVEMDGFDPNAGVIMIAATNRPDVLDPALLRPGRFDRRIVVDAPDVKGRKEILRVHLRGKPLDFDGNEAERDKVVERLAKRTPGFTGADLANLVNEAALLAARRDKNRVGMSELEESIDRIMAGPERKSRLQNDKDRKATAYHEVGHALVAELLPHADPVHKVTILPRGMALGYTITIPDEDQYSYSRTQLEDRIGVMLGGRVAEDIVYNEMTTGAADDLNRCTDLARAMVCEYGMSDRLGPLRFGRRHGNPFLGRDVMEDRDYSEEIAQAIDEEIRGLIDRNYQRAKDILESHREAMERVVDALMTRETLDRDDFLAVLNGETITSDSSTPTVPPTTGTTAEERDSPRPRIDTRLRPEPGTA